MRFRDACNAIDTTLKNLFPNAFNRVSEITAFDWVYPFEFQEKYNTNYAGLVEVQLKEAFYVIVGDPTKFKDYLDMNYMDYVSYLHSRANVIDEQKEQLNNK